VIFLPLGMLVLDALGAVCILVFDALSLGETHPNIYTAVSAALFCTTAALNVYVTCLIVGRLWWTGRQASKLCGNTTSGNQYARIITALAEGGILYTVGTVLFIVFLFLNAMVCVCCYGAVSRKLTNVQSLLIYQNVFGTITCITPTIIYLVRSYCLKVVL